jgi:hypothetical protein
MAMTTSLLPAFALMALGMWLDRRANRAFDLLAVGASEECEKLALEEATRELPGPVSDEYLTAAAIARAMQGDVEAARGYLDQREGSVHDLHGLSRYLHRPLGAAVLMGLGEPELALDLMGELDERKEEAVLCLSHVSLLLASARYRRAQEILEVVMQRFTSPAVVRDTHALLLRLARETWDPELEKLLPGFEPQSAWEAEVQLSSRLFLAEIEGRFHDAEMVSKKLMQLRCQQAEVEYSEEFFLWRDSLKSAQLHARESRAEDLQALLERSARVRDGLDEKERENIEGRYLEAWLEMSLALRTGRDQDALLEGEEDQVLGFSGGVLAASRVLIQASLRGDGAGAARDLITFRGAFRELPALEASSSVLKILRGTELDEKDRFSLRKALFARTLFPPEVARILQDLPSR